MRRKWKRILAVVLATLICGMMALHNGETVFATETQEPETESVQQNPHVTPDVSSKETENQKQPEGQDNSEPDRKDLSEDNANGQEDPTELPAEENKVIGGQLEKAQTFNDARMTSVDFTEQAIIDAGIVDEKLAEAIYNSITKQPDAFPDGNTLTANSFTSIEELLNNFNGELDASNCGIEDITGISKLKSLLRMDISKNNIRDLRPLSCVHEGAVDRGDIEEHERKYYGAFGKDTIINATENPIHFYPGWLGGRVEFEPTIGGKVVNLTDNVISYISSGNSGDSTILKMPIDLYINEARVNLVGDDTALYDTDNTGATITSEKGGQLEFLNIENISKSGSFEIELFAVREDQLKYFHVSNAIRDSVTDDGQNLSWLIPVTAKIYTTVEKEPLTTSHTVTLSKYGQDDNQLKSGATYTLYKMEGEVVNVNKDTKVGQYTTGKNGQIIVPDLEAGKYYFIEKNDGAPVGYNSNSEPVEFELGNGELVLENKTGDTVQEKPIDGAYVLGGDASDDITIKVNPPKDGSLERLKVVWTEGNQGGNPGTREYVIGEGTSKGDVIYVKNQEAAIAAAEAQLKDCHEKYQNVKISASFTQKVSVEQTDPLKPVDISIKASKTLLNTKDAPITPIPQFEFTLENDPDFPDTPEQNLTATNDAQGKIAFQAFQVGSEISSKKDVYQYHYILKETKDKVTKDEGSPEYAYEYDTEVWKVTVNVIKDAEGLKVQSVTYDKQDGGSNESNTTGAEFTNRRQSAPLEFVKVDERVKEVSGAGFTLYECKNTQDGHDHSEGCNWDNKTPYRKEIKSGDNGKIRFEELPVGQSYILVETTIPKGFKVPAEGSYIVASIALDGTLTLSGRGDFAKEGMISVDGGNYAVQNIHQYNLSIKKTIEGDGGNLDYKFNFKITFKDAKDNLINGTYQYTGSSFDKAEKPEDGTITFENGIATIQLKHGQVITIQDIDAKSKYEVVEKETGIDGYQTTVNGANSTDLDSDKTASFTNMKISAPKTGLWGITGTGTETIFLLLAGLAITGFCIRRKRRI